MLVGAHVVKEQIDSASVEAKTRWQKFRFNFGVRYEHSRTVRSSFDPLPRANVVVAGHTVDAADAANTTAAQQGWLGCRRRTKGFPRCCGYHLG